jgi:methylmalonyl-CoA/ethylmalonyl-CoA epimerase
MENDISVHHIGYAVGDIEKARGVFVSLGYTVESPLINDTGRNIKILLLRSGDTLVELIAILDTGKASPIDFIFKKEFAFPGKGIPYHICYLVQDIDQAIIRLKRENFKIIQPRMKAPAFAGNDVAFLYHRDIGIIELLQNKT